MANPWDQLPDEPATAYCAFRIFMELGPKRTLEQAWTRHIGVKKESRKSRASGPFRRWAKIFRWAERTRAWEAWMASRQIEAQAKAGEQLAEERFKRIESIDEDAWVIAQQLKVRGLQMLTWPLETTKTVGKDGKTTIVTPAKWSFRDAVLFLKIGDELARIAVGLPVNRAGSPAIVEKAARPEAEILPARLAAKFLEFAASEALELMGLEGYQPIED